MTSQPFIYQCTFGPAIAQEERETRKEVGIDDCYRSGSSTMNDRSKQLIRASMMKFLIFTGQASEQSTEACYEDETILRVGKGGRLK